MFVATTPHDDEGIDFDDFNTVDVAEEFADFKLGDLRDSLKHEMPCFEGALCALLWHGHWNHGWRF